MTNIGEILKKLVENGDSQNPDFRNAVYAKAENALIKMSQNSPSPEEYLQTWRPVLENEIAALEAKYSGFAEPEQEDEAPEVGTEPKMDPVFPEIGSTDSAESFSAQEPLNTGVEHPVIDEPFDPNPINIDPVLADPVIGEPLSDEPVFPIPDEASENDGVQPEIANAQEAVATLPEEPEAKSRGWLLPAILGAAVFAIGGYFLGGKFGGNLAGNFAPSSTIEKPQLVEFGLGEKIENVPDIEVQNGNYVLTDSSQEIRQVLSTSADKIDTGIEHRVIWSVKQDEAAKHRPAISIDYSGRGVKRASFFYSLDVAKGDFSGSRDAANNKGKLVLNDGFWEFSQVVRPSAGHTTVRISIYPAFSGTKTGTIEATKVSLQPVN